MRVPILVIAIGIFVFVTYCDVRDRRIPNTLCLAIATLGALDLVLANDPIYARYTLVTATVVFAAAVLLFWRGIIGGGDAKLVAAVVLLIGHHQVFGFLVLMSVFGGVLALAALSRDICRSHLVRPRWLACTKPSIAVAAAPADSKASTIPYGVAIAAAGAITLTL